MSGGNGGGGAGLEVVHHNETLTGDGTELSPLGVSPSIGYIDDFIHNPADYSGHIRLTNNRDFVHRADLYLRYKRRTTCHYKSSRSRNKSSTSSS